jgi:hypothetical protein
MRTPKLALVLVLAAAAGLNCDDDKTSGADAGTGGRGGSAATGGTGGSAATGGTGGSIATGGTGGTTATGGTGAGTGGTTATGGTGGTTATGGTGGTAATGGTGGTSATGGTGGTGTGGTGGMPASCEIPCLTNLISNCAPMGTCMSQTTLLPTPSFNQCYSNGVKLSTAISVGGGGGGTVAVTYSKMGAVCYSIEAAGAGAGMNFTFSYKNPAGTVVATGTYDNATMKTTLTCAGSAMTYDLSSAACANVPRGTMPGTGGGDAGAGNCPMGACP